MQGNAVFVLMAVLVACAQSLSEDEAPCSLSGYQCVGRELYRQCVAPPESRIFSCDPGTVCSYAETSGAMCIDEPPSCDIAGAFRVAGSCSRYYLCIQSGSKLKQFIGYCEPGFEFSIKLGQCVEPNMAGCSQPEPMKTTEEPSTTDEVTTEDTRNTTIPAPPPSFECTAAGNYADVVSCRHFYQCSRKSGGGLNMRRLLCPRLLPHFNPQLRTCWFLNDQCMASCTAPTSPTSLQLE